MYQSPYTAIDKKGKPLNRQFVIVSVAVLVLLSGTLPSTSASQCYTRDVLPKSEEALSRNAISKFGPDWNGDGIRDKVLLVKNGSCVQLAVFCYDRNRKIVSHEISGDLGTGEYGAHPTRITMDKNIIFLKTGGMRNEVVLRFRYSGKTKQTVLIGEEVEYYTSGRSGPSRVSINYLNKQKYIYTSVFDEKEQQFKYRSGPKKRAIKRGPRPLSEINTDSMYDDAENE